MAKTMGNILRRAAIGSVVDGVTRFSSLENRRGGGFRDFINWRAATGETQPVTKYQCKQCCQFKVTSGSKQLRWTELYWPITCLSFKQDWPKWPIQEFPVPLNTASLNWCSSSGHFERTGHQLPERPWPLLQTILQLHKNLCMACVVRRGYVLSSWWWAVSSGGWTDNPRSDEHLRDRWTPAWIQEPL